MLFTKDFPVPGEQDAVMFSTGNDPFARLLSVMLGEIASAAKADQMQGFFLAVGKRLADGYPVGPARAMDRLIQHSNMVWQMLGMGQVRFELDDEGIDIFHHGLPAKLEGDGEGVWAKAAPFILQGAYDSWFRQMGSGERLKTAILRAESGGIELRHGI